MKRIQSACLAETIHFTLRDDIGTAAAARAAAEEVAVYKEQLSRSRTKYKIVSETTGQDGSVTIKILKQYNTYPVGGYME